MDYITKDSNGYTPDRNLIGKKYQHIKNKKIYKISGFVWNGETDTWNILHQGEMGALFVRSVNNFFEKGRFTDECSKPR